jgi:hypothetical protein
MAQQREVSRVVGVPNPKLFDFPEIHRSSQSHVEEMKRLAEQGEGLATYINREVGKNYARKL